MSWTQFYNSGYLTRNVQINIYIFFVFSAKSPIPDEGEGQNGYIERHIHRLPGLRDGEYLASVVVIQAEGSCQL